MPGLDCKSRWRVKVFFTTELLFAHSHRDTIVGEGPSLTHSCAKCIDTLPSQHIHVRPGWLKFSLKTQTQKIGLNPRLYMRNVVLIQVQNKVQRWSLDYCIDQMSNFVGYIVISIETHMEYVKQRSLTMGMVWKILCWH